MAYRYYIIIPAILISSCNKSDKAVLTYIKTLDYPSASAIEYTNNRFFVMGDDANNMFILDSSFNIKDSIAFYSYAVKRIPKDVKPDLESMALFKDSSGSMIFLFGSGSLIPYRNVGWRYDLQTKIKDSISLESLYSQIKLSGIQEINIEGACFLPGYLVLSNRGNKNYPTNHLVFINERFWEKEKDYNITIIPIGQNNDSINFGGVSGLAYAAQSDQLLLTVSTEDTRNAYDDGAIGKSYIWIVKNISAKIKNKPIVPDDIIELESIDSRFKGQKIESACVVSETKDLVDLALAADNDDGSSTLFKIKIRQAGSGK